jgi:hypothetical protein
MATRSPVRNTVSSDPSKKSTYVPISDSSAGSTLSEVRALISAKGSGGSGMGKSCGFASGALDSAHIHSISSSIYIPTSAGSYTANSRRSPTSRNNPESDCGTSSSVNTLINWLPTTRPSAALLIGCEISARTLKLSITSSSSAACLSRTALMMLIRNTSTSASAGTDRLLNPSRGILLINAPRI